MNLDAFLHSRSWVDWRNTLLTSPNPACVTARDARIREENELSLFLYSVPLYYRRVYEAVLPLVFAIIFGFHTFHMLIHQFVQILAHNSFFRVIVFL